MSCIYWELCIVKSGMQSSAESENQSETMESNCKMIRPFTALLANSRSRPDN